MSAHETWRPVRGYSGLYEASSEGRIRSLRSGRLMKLTLSSTSGYLVLNLSKNKCARLCVVHQVIAQAFHGAQRRGIQVDHVNGDKTDNRATNLEYVTPQENDRRATSMGLKASGDRNGSRTMPERHSTGEGHYVAKLSTKDIVRIRAAVGGGRSQRSVASEYGVNPSHVSRIMSGHTRRAG